MRLDQPKVGSDRRHDEFPETRVLQYFHVALAESPDLGDQRLVAEQMDLSTPRTMRWRLTGDEQGLHVHAVPVA